MCIGEEGTLSLKEASRLGHFQMILEEIRMKHHIMIDKNQILTRRVLDTQILNSRLADAIVCMLDLSPGKSGIQQDFFYDGVSFCTGTIIGDDYFEIIGCLFHY